MLSLTARSNANPGDRRNWNFIRTWATGVAPLLKQEK